MASFFVTHTQSKLKKIEKRTVKQNNEIIITKNVQINSGRIC